MEDHHKLALSKAVLCYLINWEQDIDGGPLTSLTDCYIVAGGQDEALHAFSAITNHIDVRSAHRQSLTSGKHCWHFQADPSEIEANLVLAELEEGDPSLDGLPHPVCPDGYNIKRVVMCEDERIGALVGAARQVEGWLENQLNACPGLDPVPVEEADVQAAACILWAALHPTIQLTEDQEKAIAHWDGEDS